MLPEASRVKDIGGGNCQRKNNIPSQSLEELKLIFDFNFSFQVGYTVALLFLLKITI